MEDNNDIPNPSLHLLVNGVVDKILDHHGAMSCPTDGSALIGQRESNYVLYVQVIVVREEDGTHLHQHMEKACKEFLDTRYGDPISVTLGPKGSKPS